MFPGLTTKLSEQEIASAATISVQTDLVKVTGTTSIATINVMGEFGGGNAGIIFIVPTDGDVATLTTGNIAIAVTMAQNRVTVLVRDKSGTWYPGAIS